VKSKVIIQNGQLIKDIIYKNWGLHIANSSCYRIYECYTRLGEKSIHSYSNQNENFVPKVTFTKSMEFRLVLRSVIANQVLD